MHAPDQITGTTVHFKCLPVSRSWLCAVTDDPAPVVRDPRPPIPSPFHVLGPTVSVRSTLLTSSLQALKSHGLASRHSELLSAEHRHARAAIAGLGIAAILVFDIEWT